MFLIKSITMKIFTLVIASVLLVFFSGNVAAVTISQCQLPDGSIEFTNQGCSKKGQLHARRTFSKNLNQSEVINVRKTKKRQQKLFKQPSFVRLQDKLIKSDNLTEMEKYTQLIIDSVKSSAQQGQLDAAYDMIAATYVRISRYLKKQRWQGQSVDEHVVKIRTLFENILISQSTTSSATELAQVIQNAWLTYLVKT